MKQKAPGANLRRALGKTALVIVLITVVVAVLGHFVSSQQLDLLKHTLDLWTIIILVIIINLVSFGCFIILFAAYQWIRIEFKPGPEDEFEH